MLEIFSHVKWFVDENTIAQNTSLSFNQLLFVIGLIIFGLFVLKVIKKFLDERGIEKTIDKKLKPHRQWAPLLVRLSTAALLIVNISSEYLLAPNVAHNDSVATPIIVGLFSFVALLLMLGVWTRFAAALLLAGYILILPETSVINVLDHLEYVGIAAYLWFRGPGAYSLSAKLSDGKLATPKGRENSLPLYRIFVGAAFVILALSEKLMNIPVAQEFLASHNWNLLGSFGVSDTWFIVIAGTIELIVGLAIMLNLAPRLLTLVVLGLMSTTAILLGIEEIYGHLFAVGFVAVIWINDTKPAKYDNKPDWL